MLKTNHDLILYIGDGCRFSHKVLDFMAAHQIEIPIKEVWNDEANMQELIDLNQRQQVPCLSIDGKPMLESDDIIEKLKEIFSVK